MDSQRIGVIDLGSNTTRLIVMQYVPHHAFRLIDEVRETVRLAEGIGADGLLQPRPMQRAIDTMRMFAAFCRATGVDTIVPTATSATREAANREAFLAAVEQASGLTFRVLSAEEEAYYGYLGAVNSLQLNNGLVIDIGGGSTQVTQVSNRRFGGAISRPIGALRLTERYVRGDPITNKAFKALETAVSDAFADMPWRAGDTVAGMGGTIRTLAEMDMKQRNYPLDMVHGYQLSAESIETIIERLRTAPLKQRELLPGLNRDRADIILAGAVIIRQIVRQTGAQELVISGRGVREGLFFEHFLRGATPPLFAHMRSFSILNLARVHDYEEAHAAKVGELALSLYDQLVPLHGYGAWERELLEYAATIHDIGVDVGYYDHHKHGEYLVLNSALQGFTHREVAILAALVRGHRKGDIALEAYRGVIAADDDVRVNKLAALLRIAEYLERSKSQVITALRVEIGETVNVQTTANGDATVEIWDANRRAGLFQKAFGRAVEIV